MNKMVHLLICAIFLASTFVGTTTAIYTSANLDEGPLEFSLEVDEVGYRHYVLTLSARNTDPENILSFEFDSGVTIIIWRESVMVNKYDNLGPDHFETTIHPNDDKILLRAHWYGFANTEDGKIKFGSGALPEGMYEVIGYCPEYSVTVPYEAYYEAGDYRIDPVTVDLPEPRSKSYHSMIRLIGNFPRLFELLQSFIKF
jgi:hypothetical protein